MSPLDRRTRCLLHHVLRTAFLVLLCTCLVTPLAMAGRITLARKYKAGQLTVYATKVSTNSKIDSNPPELKRFFPPVPTGLRLNQQTTVTVTGVHPDGAVDVQQRFDQFEIKTEAEGLPANVRESMAQAQK